MSAVISCMHLKHNRRPTPYLFVLCGVVMGQPSTNDGPTCNNIGGFKGEGQGAMPPPPKLALNKFQGRPSCASRMQEFF